MDNCRMFLVEKGRFVVIRNEAEEIGFATFEEFYAYCPVAEFGIDLTGNVYIDYEPDRGVYVDSADKTVDAGNAPVAAFEALIDSIDLLKARKNDPLFGKNPEEAKVIKVGLVKAEASSRIYAKWPEHKQRNAGVAPGRLVRQEDVDAMAADIEAVVAAVDDAELEITAAGDMEAVKAVSPAWPVI